MGRAIPRSFYRRNTSQVARDLLGSLLVRITPNGERISGVIIETEAYLPNDAASHAYNGKTQRNASMFGRPGTLYVYFIYGMHYCLNISCLPDGKAGCVLIRALEPVSGMEQMAAARGVDAAAVEREFFATARPSSVLQRFATPEEVAALITYVCGVPASATTGAALRVDGGVVRAIA